MAETTRDHERKNQQQPPEPKGHGRMSPDEMEAAVRELKEWQMHMQRVNPQYIMPHAPAEGQPTVDEGGRTDLNRAPAEQDSRRQE